MSCEAHYRNGRMNVTLVTEGDWSVTLVGAGGGGGGFADRADSTVVLEVEEQGAGRPCDV